VFAAYEIAMTMSDLSQRIAFLAEIDGLKNVLRQSPLADRSRRENSAEHSWHLAMFAMVLGDLAEGVDISRVIEMLLLHDIVEIDAGDTPIHAVHDHDAQIAAERDGARRIFGILPDAQRNRLMALWAEFEAAETQDARFAKALDRMQPLLLNTLTEGGTWTENGVTEQQVYERYGPVIDRGSAILWLYARDLVQQHFSKLASA
jgi:putative hydrolases of HD superfamily